MVRTKYPVEVASIVRTNKTLGFNSFLFRADSSENESPYKIYGKFSRYAISILDTSGTSNKSVRGNIRVTEIADIERRTQYAFNKHMQFETKGSLVNNEGSSSRAYTVKITTGSLKGKTPAEVITDGNGKLLMQHKKFLEQHLQQYPNNKIQIEAINEAVILYKEGTLENKKDVQGENEIITLYNAGMHPLTRQKREDGKCLVYEINITWRVGANYPVTMTVSNYYARAEKMNDGRLNVKDVDEQSKIRLNVSISEAEWFNILSSIERNMNQFEVLTAKTIFNDANQTYITTIQESKELRAMPSDPIQRQSTTQYQTKNFSFKGNY